jgi:hypothetical protein
MLATLIALTRPAAAEPVLIDGFESLDAWNVMPSEGVEAHASLVEGRHGKALRLDFEFKAGAGFCVLRRATPMALPANYRFAFDLRGECPRNNLEFKLVDDSGDSVWWVNRRAYEFPAEWRHITQRARQFRFAWGPGGGKPFDHIGAIEFAIASSAGGKGYIVLDSLTFEELPAVAPVTCDPTVSFSSGTPRGPLTLGADGRIGWKSDEADTTPTITADFGNVREFGGLILEWDGQDFPTAYDLLTSTDGSAFEHVATIRGAAGGRRYLQVPDGEARLVRLHATSTSRGRGVKLDALRIAAPEFGESANAMMAVIGKDSPRGRYPRWSVGEQQYWTVVGAAGDDQEALLSVDGSAEVGKGAFTLEPFILQDGRLITWADGDATQTLEDGCLPIPSVTRTVDGLELRITALAEGDPGTSTLRLRYTLTNRRTAAAAGRLAIAIRPFQVLPPWQDLNMTGGVSPVRSIRFGRNEAEVDQREIILVTPPDAACATPWAAGEIVERLAEQAMPREDSIKDPDGLASGALLYDFSLMPGESLVEVIDSPFRVASPSQADFDASLKASRRFWQGQVGRARLALPQSAQDLSDTFKASQAYILINRDGPAIQPGSRTYERSWIRDGSLTGTALLVTGHAQEFGEFLDWYAGFQFPSGKVPCVVDSRGPDPVPEHDSCGEYLYAVQRYYRFTRDRAFLERHLPHVIAAVGYLESLRAQRLTDEFRLGPPDKLVLYGLLPESISHEGYSAKPMHSYWDDFFALKGFEDAAAIARELGRSDLEQRFGRLRDGFRATLLDSIRLAMRQHAIDYIPGCAELGDFDATSTAIGVFPCDQFDQLRAPFTATFDRYLSFFRTRRDGGDWRDFTPYENRLIGTFVLLGRPDQAHELADYFLRFQRPLGWREWAEVVWRDPSTPRFIGDMPHTWVASEFVNAVRTMFVYEQGDGLVLAAGLKPQWLSEPGGVRIEAFPTEFGPIGYSFARTGDVLRLELSAETLEPGCHCRIAIPHPEGIDGMTVDGRPAAWPATPMVEIDPHARRVEFHLKE